MSHLDGRVIKCSSSYVKNASKHIPGTKKKKKDVDLEYLDIWLVLQLWIIVSTRVQRYKKVKATYQNATENTYTDDDMLLEPYNRMIDELPSPIRPTKLTRKQLRNKIRVIVPKCSNMFTTDRQLMLENILQHFPCFLFRDYFKFNGGHFIGDFESSTNYVKINRNGNQWELHNLKTYEEPQKAFDLEMFRSNLIQLSVMCCNSPVNNTSLNLEFLNQSMDTTSMYDNAMIID